MFYCLQCFLTFPVILSITLPGKVGFQDVKGPAWAFTASVGQTLKSEPRLLFPLILESGDGVEIQCIV